MMFQDAALPVDAENTWKFFTTLDFPVRGGGKIPVAVVFSNDPNAIDRQRFVSGQIGLNYDFSALKQLFAAGPYAGRARNHGRQLRPKICERASLADRPDGHSLSSQLNCEDDARGRLIGVCLAVCRLDPGPQPIDAGA